MKIVLVNSHPYDKSFNAAISEKVEATCLNNNHSVEVIDLIKDNFNAVMGQEDLLAWSMQKFANKQSETYFDKLFIADLVVFTFPIWWAGMPAVLKGFVDKVFLPTKAYHYGPNGELVGNFKGTDAVVITTMESPVDFYDNGLKDPITNEFIRGTLNTCGITNVTQFKLEKVVSSGDDGRKAYLKEIEDYFSTL